MRTGEHTGSPAKRIPAWPRAVVWGWIVLLAGCGEQAEPADADDGPIAVQTARAESREIREVLTRAGQIRATAIVAVRPEISGIVQQIHFEEGNAVEADELLFSIDDRKLRKQLAAEEAALEAARSRADMASLMYRRYEELLDHDAAAMAERDQRRTEWETAQAEIERRKAQIALLQEKLGDAEIRAPMAGSISESQVDRGDLVTVGQLLTVLYAPSSEVRFSVPEDYVRRVSLGQAVEVHLAAFPDDFIGATVSFIDPRVDEQTRTFLVKARIEEWDSQLKSGMFATVDLILRSEDDKPVISSEALVATEIGYVVYVVENGTAHRRSVEIGLRQPGEVQIVQGLEAGELLVTSGQMRLTDGVEVRATEEADPGDESASMVPEIAESAATCNDSSGRVTG